jgi:DinB superfamily
MLVDDFRRRLQHLYAMTVDFIEVVPSDRWDFSPDPSAGAAVSHDPLRHGVGFAPFSKQLRHVVCVRGVYNAALLTKKADFAKKHDHFRGPPSRAALLAALAEKQSDLLAMLDTVDTNVPIDFFGTPFSFGDFAFTVVQHEAIHHGQWSIYAALGGFRTPLSWRNEWGL